MKETENNNQPEPKELDNKFIEEFSFFMFPAKEDDKDAQKREYWYKGADWAKSHSYEYYQFKINQLEEENKKLKESIVEEVKISYGRSFINNDGLVSSEDYIESIKSKYNI